MPASRTPQGRRLTRAATFRQDLQRMTPSARVSAIVARFPHLSQQAYIPTTQAAGDRIRATYERDTAARQLSAIGYSHRGRPAVLIRQDLTTDTTRGRAYTVGLDFPDAMGRMLIVYRGNALAAYGRDPAQRLHAITQALRIRGDLAWNGLDASRRIRSPLPVTPAHTPHHS